MVHRLIILKLRRLLTINVYAGSRLGLAKIMYRPRQGLVYRVWSRYKFIYRQYIFICLRNYLTFSTKGTIIFLFCLDLHCILVITLFDNEHEVQCFFSYEFSFKNGLHSSLIINIKIFFFKYLNNTLLILVILHKIVIDLHKDWDEIFTIRKNNFYFFYKISSCNINHGIGRVAFGIWTFNILKMNENERLVAMN